MNPETELRAHPPKTLSRARAIAHIGAQFLTKAARANLPVVPDDSHSNLGWDDKEQRFLTQPLPSTGKNYSVGLSLSPLRLSLVTGNQIVADLDLEKVSCSDAAKWLDGRLDGIGLRKASAVKLPYDLPPEVSEINIFYAAAEAERLSALACWFDLAHSVLSGLAKGNSSLVPGPSPVRCWPHHFDIATYVSFETGDFETARGIGVGMSPGDESYDQPYFYINPWPHIKTDDLPELPAPGHWHTKGFVGAIATSEEVLSLNNIADQFPEFVNSAFSIEREALGV